jgi:hypothetical protein
MCGFVLSFTAPGNAEGHQGRIQPLKAPEGQEPSFKVCRSGSCEQAQHCLYDGQGRISLATFPNMCSGAS